MQKKHRENEKREINYIEWKIDIEGKEYGQKMMLGCPMSSDELFLVLTVLVQGIKRSIKETYEK